VERGLARHFWLLPGDHGAGDSAYSRPAFPNKYSGPRPRRRPGGQGSPPTATGESVEQYVWRTWGKAWEALNPASPSRLLFSLTYHGVADGLTSSTGHCLICFHPGLDIRLPQPENHECGPLCGLHRDGNRALLPTAVKRAMLAAGSVRGVATEGAAGFRSREGRITLLPGALGGGDVAEGAKAETGAKTRAADRAAAVEAGAQADADGAAAAAAAGVREEVGSQLQVAARPATAGARAGAGLETTAASGATAGQGVGAASVAGPSGLSGRSQEHPFRTCTVYWAGAVRGRSNPVRAEIMGKLAKAAGKYCSGKRPG
jgi:hypothetical protein